MDKETAVEIERLKAADEAKNKRIEDLEEIAKTWNSLIRSVIMKTVSLLLAVGVAGLIFGSRVLPEDIRKSLLEWIQK